MGSVRSQSGVTATLIGAGTGAEPLRNAKVGGLAKGPLTIAALSIVGKGPLLEPVAATDAPRTHRGRLPPRPSQRCRIAPLSRAAMASPSATAVNTSLNEWAARGNCCFMVCDTSDIRLEPPT